MEMRCKYRLQGTLVDNEFIDKLMPEANGEYVKVYLYLLRHQDAPVEVSGIAEALRHTEADVRRALAYWERMGAICADEDQARESTGPQAGAGMQQGAGVRAGAGAAEYADAQAGAGVPETTAGRAKERPVYSQEQVNRLAGNEDFTQLLYIAQRLLKKVFTPRECEVFAYLYDGLHLSSELLEYLVEHCAEGGHTSIRYIETVGLNWHERGIRTVEEAKTYTSGFRKDSFAVMRAFGLTDRRPGSSELDMMDRWFGQYGFTKELVLEACSRTLEATHSPSFRYADKILSEWKKAGVRTLSDVGSLDEQRKGRRSTPKAKANQFHNFEQRNTDYDSMMLEDVKSWIGS